MIAYTFFHIPMVAGVIVAAAEDELALAHPGDQVDTAKACVILGGPVLFLVGHTLFKRALWGLAPLPRPATIGFAIALVPVAVVSTRPVLLALVTAVVVAAACAGLAGLFVDRRQLVTAPRGARDGVQERVGSSVRRPCEAVARGRGWTLQRARSVAPVGPA